MKSLVLHIGLQKTGTTSLQGFLHQNTDALERAGYIYPRWVAPSFDVVNAPSYHGHLVAYCADFRCSFAKPTADDVARFFDAIPDDGRTVLISAEDFSRFSEPDRALEVFKDFDVQVVIYLREQTRWMESVFNQGNKILLRRGDPALFAPDRLSEKTLLRFLRAQRYIWMTDFQELLGRWENAFGRNRVTARVFDRAEFLGGSLYSDFLALLGVSSVESFDQTNDLNMNLANEVIQRLSQIAASEGAERALAEIRRIAEGSRAQSIDISGDYTVFTREARERMQATYAASNAAVAHRFFGRETLFPEKALQPPPAAADAAAPNRALVL